MNENSKYQDSVSVLKNSIYIIGAQIIAKLLVFAFYIVLSRYLGDTGLGKYSFIVGLVGVFGVIASFGFDNLMVRDLAIQKKDASKYLSNICITKTFFSIISIIILVLIIQFTDKSSDVIIGVSIFCITLIFDGLSKSIEAVFNAFEQLKYIALIEIIINVFKVFLALYIRSSHLTLVHLLIGIVFLSLLRVAFALIILNYKFFKLQFSFNYNFILQHCKTAYPFALMGIISIIYFRIDTIMLSFYKEDAAVGWYSAAFNFITMLMFISYGFSRAIFPVLSKYYNESKEALLDAGEKSFNYLFIIALPIALGITVLADRVVLTVYGDVFVNSIWAIRILIWSLPFIYINSPLLRILYSAHKQKSALKIALFSMSLNVIMNFILIPKFSYIGACISTVVSEIINFIFYYIVILKKFSYKVKLSSSSIRAILGSVLMGGVLYLLRDLNMFLQIFVSTVFYFATLYFLKVFTAFEVNLVKSLFRKRTN